MRLDIRITWQGYEGEIWVKWSAQYYTYTVLYYTYAKLYNALYEQLSGLLPLKWDPNMGLLVKISK